MAESIPSWRKLLEKEIDIDKLIRRLSYSDEQVTEAARKQGILFLDAAIFRTQLMKRRQRIEAKLKELRSTLASTVRDRLTDSGQRVTDKAVEEVINKNVRVNKLESKLASYIRYEEGAKLLLEAYRMRSASFKTVTDMLGAEIYLQRRLEGKDTNLMNVRDSIKEKLAYKYPGKKKRVKDD